MELMEGQEKAIARLHTRTPLRLYMPLSVRDAIELSEHGLTSMPKHEIASGGLSSELGYPVTHSLKYAMKHGDVVIQFREEARRLKTLPQYTKTSIHKLAVSRYPESQLPIVSLMMLNDKTPWVMYHGSLSPGMVDLYHLITITEKGIPATEIGVQDSLTPEEFEVWTVNVWRTQTKGGSPRPRGQKLIDLMHQARPESYD